MADLGVLARQTLEAGEALLEDPRLRQASPQREAALGELGVRLSAALAEIAGPRPLLAGEKGACLAQGFFHLRQGWELMAAALQASQGVPGGFRAAYGELCRAQAFLYPIRHDIGLETHWLTPEAASRAHAGSQPPVSPHHRPVGVLYKDWRELSPRYSLYVPEDYDPARVWPLVVALHGAGGDDRDFLWLWLRQAKSRGYLLLVPKSQDFTWSFSDLRAVLLAVKEVQALYRVEKRAVFLTGFSDGGTFTYEFGLGNPEVFAAIGPIAGALVPWPWRDLNVGCRMPVYILHGALDNQVPVQMARQSRDILAHFGYRVSYHEHPKWGHTYPFSRLGGLFDFFDQVRGGEGVPSKGA
ncbi:MAG: hypothetical protein HY687_04250 [Chloroflexi bacterium]|nr:hypothetical protein [Chloroflexota bacterium]